MLFFQTAAEVLFDYEKTQDDELSLMVGDIIQDVVTVSCVCCFTACLGIQVSLL